MSTLENTLRATGLNIIEFLSWVICGGVILLVALAVIGCICAWRDDR